MTHAPPDSPPSPRRVVAIVGRPNVGKSALFNRIVRRRVAIVHEESGVTRDRLSVVVTWGDERFELIDTGGLAMMDGSAAPDLINQGIREQIEVAVQDAAVVLLVVDVTAGCMPLDEEVARVLRERGANVLVAANKADAQSKDGLADEFSGLGFPVQAVSALHGRGVEPLVDDVLRGLPEAAEEDDTEPLKVAIVGRPNVGKSSYVNRLLKDERVIVSDIPGTTRDSVEVPFVVGRGKQQRHYRLIDTAGIRRPGKIDSVVERYSLARTERSIRRADLVVMMMDASQGPTTQDKKIARQILDSHSGCLILVNKWDIAMEAEITQRRYGEALRKAIPFLSFVPTLFVSATSGFNIRRSVDAMDYVSASISTTLSTGVLNRVLRDAFQKTNPPLVKGKRLKLYYATQTGTRPIELALFVNQPRCLTSAYEAYLVRRLREAFGLEGAPVRLRFRSSHGDQRKP